jgi:hypothetical protein
MSVRIAFNSYEVYAIVSIDDYVGEAILTIYIDFIKEFTTEILALGLFLINQYYHLIDKPFDGEKNLEYIIRCIVIHLFLDLLDMLRM